MPSVSNPGRQRRLFKLHVRFCTLQFWKVWAAFKVMAEKDKETSFRIIRFLKNFFPPPWNWSILGHFKSSLPTPLTLRPDDSLWQCSLSISSFPGKSAGNPYLLPPSAWSTPLDYLNSDIIERPCLLFLFETLFLPFRGSAASGEIWKSAAAVFLAHKTISLYYSLLILFANLPLFIWHPPPIFNKRSEQLQNRSKQFLVCFTKMLKKKVQSLYPTVRNPESSSADKMPTMKAGGSEFGSHVSTKRGAWLLGL